MARIAWADLPIFQFKQGVGDLFKSRTPGKDNLRFHVQRTLIRHSRHQRLRPKYSKSLQPNFLLALNLALKRRSSRRLFGWFFHGDTCKAFTKTPFDANRYSPELLGQDQFGERFDEIRYHPSYHCLMELQVAAGVRLAHY